ncbi:HAD hydrolase-like protein [uncultured Oscillibacter sp.]|jgi:phosphoglycolate phosphatase|uniref:HAD hydrolase-like protein n=1 Tax=uncultured Oscillibacter sp. TaxID=876091 RepID=UPI0025E0A5BF|nr:HAD hydrolase-like protein [uncultured Oscillibacter sp.]
MYRYILFDLDGTLTDSREGIVRCVRETILGYGDPPPEEETLLRFIGPPLQDSFIRFCGYSAEKAAEAVERFRLIYEPTGQYENRAAPGMEAVMGRLKERGYVLALASSKPENLCVSICARFGFTPHLTALVGSPPHGDWKKEDVVREALRRLGLTARDLPQVLMVGDRKFDVLGARACGVDCAGVEFFGYAPPGELAEAGAVAVVKTPEELEEFILAH